MIILNIQGVKIKSEKVLTFFHLPDRKFPNSYRRKKFIIKFRILLRVLDSSTRVLSKSIRIYITFEMKKLEVTNFRITKT